MSPVFVGDVRPSEDLWRQARGDDGRCPLLRLRHRPTAAAAVAAGDWKPSRGTVRSRTDPLSGELYQNLLAKQAAVATWPIQ